jgi:hypothetical protein
MNWRELTSRLGSLREDELEQMIQAELAGPKRLTLLVRMHQRYTVLRSLRERQEMTRMVSQQS